MLTAVVVTAALGVAGCSQPATSGGAFVLGSVDPGDGMLKDARPGHPTLRPGPAPKDIARTLVYVAASDPSSRRLQLVWLEGPQPGCGNVTVLYVTQTARQVIVEPSVETDIHVQCMTVAHAVSDTVTLEQPLGNRQLLQMKHAQAPG